MRPLLRRLWSSSGSRYCSSLSSSQGWNVERSSSAGNFFRENGNQQQQQNLNISSGALHLRPMPRSTRAVPYRSQETIPEFFSNMEAAIKVGTILREHGWTSETLQKLEALKVSWTPFMVTQVLRQPLEKDTAWAFFQWLKSVRGYRHTQRTYNTMVDVYGRARDVGGIQRVLDDMTAYGCGMNVVTFTTVIHWYHKADDVEKALDMWNHMVRVGCQPNVITYTMLMSMLVNLNRFEKVGEMLKDMITAGVKPNVRTYNVLINCLAKAGHRDAALEVFRKLPSLKASPTVTTFRVIMEAAASTGDLELLGTLVEELKESGRKPNSKMYFAIVESLKKAGKLEEGGALVKELLGILEDNETQAVQGQLQIQEKIHETKERDDDEDEASLPLQDMEVMEGLDRALVDMKAFSTLLLGWGPETVAALEASKFRWNPWKVLRVLMGLKDPQVALKFFYWLEKQPGYKHDSFVYTKMIHILVYNNHLNGVDDMLQRMQNQGVEVNVVTMNSLISMFVSAPPKNWYALKMYYWMLEMKVKPDMKTYTMLIHMLVKRKGMKKALIIYKAMLEGGCKPDTHTYTALIELLGETRRVDAAFELFEKMREYGCKPNVLTYNSLIKSFMGIGMASRALALLKTMQERDNIQPNWETFNVLARGLNRSDMRAELVELEKVMQGKNLWWNLRRNSHQISTHDLILERLAPVA